MWEGELGSGVLDQISDKEKDRLSFNFFSQRNIKHKRSALFTFACRYPEILRQTILIAEDGVSPHSPNNATGWVGLWEVQVAQASLWSKIPAHHHGNDAFKIAEFHIKQ